MLFKRHELTFFFYEEQIKNCKSIFFIIFLFFPFPVISIQAQNKVPIKIAEERRIGSYTLEMDGAQG